MRSISPPLPNSGGLKVDGRRKTCCSQPLRVATRQRFAPWPTTPNSDIRTWKSKLAAFLLNDTLSCGEFAAQNDVLLNESTLFTTPLGTASNLLPQIPDSRIGIESRLPFSAFDCADFGLGLFEGGIVFNG